MNAAKAAAEQGVSVILADKSIYGRGGATVMAQMTVAVALGEEEEDSPELHFQDTVTGGRGLAEERLARVFAELAPRCIRELGELGVNWARRDGHIAQVHAPGHSRKRCVYVDVLSSGKAVSQTLQKVVRRFPNVRRMSNLFVVDLVVHDGEAAGAVALDVERGELYFIEAKAVILAAGGLTDLYARTSASSNMTGDAYALAARAGLRLIDMEMVQFFPIGTLYPRLVGFDPVMWDPFRYKLGGRLLNGLQEEFIHRYGSSDEGKYTAPRDVATLAILSEVKAGRGSPHGGAYLDFRDIPESKMYEAWGGVIDQLKEQGLDLTQQQVEVAPIAHFMIGGIAVNDRLETAIPGIFAAGEATGGTHGANRLSGNALTEAIVHGVLAGQSAAQYIRGQRQNASFVGMTQPVRELIERVEGLLGRNSRTGGSTGERAPSAAAVKRDLRSLMWEKVGPFRHGKDLQEAVAELKRLRDDVLPLLEVPQQRDFNLQWLERLELENMILVGLSITESALARKESRGAHQRLDFEQTVEEQQLHYLWSQDGLETRPVGGVF